MRRQTGLTAATPSCAGDNQHMSLRGADDLDRIADLPDDNSREKEVYARFGLAMFHAQVFESGMVMMIAALVTVENERAGTRGGGEVFADLLEDLYSRTAGKLLTRLRDQAALSPDLEALLKKAIGLRNDLTHRWFRENSAGFGSADGMQGMVDDLDQARATFNRASAQVHAHAGMMFMSLVEAPTEEEIARLQERYVRDLESGRS